MATYRTNSLYQGPLPVVVVIDGDEYKSDEDGAIVDPSDKVARMLEGMPEWVRVEGDTPFGPNDVVASTNR